MMYTKVLSSIYPPKMLQEHRMDSIYIKYNKYNSINYYYDGLDSEAMLSFQSPPALHLLST